MAGIARRGTIRRQDGMITRLTEIEIEGCRAIRWSQRPGLRAELEPLHNAELKELLRRRALAAGEAPGR